jgi:putative ABC transport system permease protein
VVLATEERARTAAARLRALWPAKGRDPLESIQSVGVFARGEWMDALGASTATGAVLSNMVWMIIVGVAIVMISTLNLITIRERYDEIAIRRCEGARRRDVALQVTAEGVLTSLVGGLAGLPLGYAGAEMLRRIVEFPFRFELRYALAAIVVAIALGLLASVIPARRAARMQPARVLGRRLT